MYNQNCKSRDPNLKALEECKCGFQCTVETYQKALQFDPLCVVAAQGLAIATAEDTLGAFSVEETQLQIENACDTLDVFAKIQESLNNGVFGSLAGDPSSSVPYNKEVVDQRCKYGEIIQWQQDEKMHMEAAEVSGVPKWKNYCTKHWGGLEKYMWRLEVEHEHKAKHASKKARGRSVSGYIENPRSVNISSGLPFVPDDEPSFSRLMGSIPSLARAMLVKSLCVTPSNSWRVGGSSPRLPQDESRGYSPNKECLIPSETSLLIGFHCRWWMAPTTSISFVAVTDESLFYIDGMVTLLGVERGFDDVQ
ncbi:hypothetical protein F5141DRAFT_1068391 [Pisolithus sp. B1]|nr:hypothetical protein F5141DRAFT_1068391 [Pisolithus sp. B1]